MALSVPAPFDPSQAVLIEARQEFNSFAQYGGNPPVLVRGPWGFSGGLTAPSIGTRVDNTPLGTVGEHASSAGSDGGSELGNCVFPLWESMAGLPRSRRPRRYQTGLTIAATVRGTARLEYMLTNGSQHVSFGNGGVGWLSDPAINGGMWTPFWRLTAGGATVLGGASNVQFDATFHVLEIRFEEAGRWSWLIDGETIFSFTGLNFSAFNGGTGWTPRFATSRVVGTTYQFQDPYYRVSEI